MLHKKIEFILGDRVSNETILFQKLFPKEFKVILLDLLLRKSEISNHSNISIAADLVSLHLESYDDFQQAINEGIAWSQSIYNCYSALYDCLIDSTSHIKTMLDKEFASILNSEDVLLSNCSIQTTVKKPSTDVHEIEEGKVTSFKTVYFKHYSISLPDKTLSEVEDVFFLVDHYGSSEKKVLYTIDVKCEKNIVLDKSLNNLMLKKGLTSIVEAINQISMEDKRVLYFLSLSDEQGEVGKTILPDLVGVNSKGKEVTIKPTRFFARFPELFSNADLELISSSLKIVNNVKVEIVDGELINKYYLGETYSTTNTELYSKSNLYKSCMRYPQKNEAINIYSQNPDRVRMAVVLDSTGVVARALLWKTDQSIILMDRIYSVEEKYERYLLNLAATNGWAFKTKQSAGVTTRITYEGEERIIHLSVSLNLTGLKHYPYMDTFAYLVMDKNRKVVLKNVPVGQYYRVLDSQNGFFPNGKEFGEDFDFDDTLGVGDFWFDTSGKPVLIDEESKVLSFIYDKYNARGNMIPKSSFKFKTKEGLYTNSDKECNFVDLYEKLYLSEVYHDDYLIKQGLTVVPTKDSVSFITRNEYAGNVMLDLTPGEIMNLLDSGYRLNVALKQSQVESYLESYYCNGFNLNDGFSPIYFLRVRKCDEDYLQAELRTEIHSVTEIVTSTDSLFKFFEVDKELFNNALLQLKKFFTPEVKAQYAGPKEESVITVDTMAMMA